MKKLITQEELKKRVMLAFFEAAQEDDDGLFARNIERMIEEKVGLHRVSLAMDDLYNGGLITSKWANIEQEHGRAISSKGYVYVEDLLKKAELASRVFEIQGQKHLPDISLLIPASDRLIMVDHSSTEYKDIKVGLDELTEEIRAANDLICSPEERQRLIKSLQAASNLWDSAELKAIQIYVGILMIVQEAIAVLKIVGKGVGKDLLVNLIVGFLKSRGISI